MSIAGSHKAVWRYMKKSHYKECRRQQCMSIADRRCWECEAAVFNEHEKE
jgi:hypothetical protein